MNSPFILILSACSLYLGCSPSATYRSLKSQNDHLTIRNSELKLENDSLHRMANELTITKEQLQKTENVLIEFYLKYNNKTSDTLSLNKNDPKSFENQRIQNIKNLENEVTQLKSQISQLELKLKSKKEPQNPPDEMDRIVKQFNKYKDSSSLVILELISRNALNESGWNACRTKEDSLNRELIKLNKIILLDEKEKEYLQFNLNELNQFKRKNDELITQNNSKEKENVTLKYELDQLKKSGDEIRMALDDKNKQIELLGLKLSEKSINEELQTENQSLKDSIQFYRIKITNQKLDQLNKLHSQRNQDSIASSLAHANSVIKSQESEIDKMEKRIGQLNIELEQLKTTETVLHDKTKTAATPETALDSQQGKQRTHPDTFQKKQSTAVTTNKIPNSYLTKLINYFNTNKNYGLQYRNTGILVTGAFPLELLFEKDRFAVNQTGTNLIENLATICKSSRLLKFKIIGFDKKNQIDPNLKTQQIRRANTIAKLLNIYGISLSNIEVTTILVNSDPYPFSSGIEINIYAD